MSEKNFMLLEKNKKVREEILQGIGKTFFCLFTGIIVGFTALCIVHLLPVDRMYRNILGSKDTVNVYEEVVEGYKSTTLDNFTDSIILNQVICPADIPLLEKVVNNYQVNYWKQYSQAENLLKYLEGETGYRYQGYSHYWGGYLTIWKPLFLIFDYADVLVINMFAQALLMLLVIFGMGRTGRGWMIMPFVIAVLSMMPVSMALSLQLCDICYIMLIGTAVVVWKHERIGNDRMHLLFLLIGMATCYFDFLTYPFVTLGIPLVAFLSYLDREKLNRKFLYVILCSIQWCVGYVGMWTGKWILGTILVPESGSMKMAINSILYRGSNTASDQTILTVFNVSLKNLYVYLRWPVMILIGTAVICLAWKVIKKRIFLWDRLLSAIPYLLIGIYPFMWYMLAKNHSYEHAFMAYRELAIATFAGLCMFAQAGEV